MSDAVRDRKNAASADGGGALAPDAVGSPMRGFARLVRAVVLLAGAVAVALVVGFAAFAIQIADASPPADPRAEGIVVFTGGSARIDSALRLLAEHRASRLLISGVNPAVGTEALAGTVDADLDAMLACCVDLGHTARDHRQRHRDTRLGPRSPLCIAHRRHQRLSHAALAG